MKVVESKLMWNLNKGLVTMREVVWFGVERSRFLALYGARKKKKVNGAQGVHNGARHSIWFMAPPN